MVQESTRMTSVVLRAIKSRVVSKSQAALMVRAISRRADTDCGRLDVGCVVIGFVFVTIWVAAKIQE